MNQVALAVVAPALLTFLPVAVGAQPASDAVEFDIQGFVAGRIKAGEHRIVVPPGQYRVTPRYGTHLLLKDLADTLIVADGVEMVCTQTCRALVFENCRNVCFRGLTVDFDPLPFTEGRIVAMAPDKRLVEFEIIEGYPEHELEERIEIYDPATGRLRRETAGWSKKIESLGSHRYRAVKPAWYRFQKDWDTEQVGDILVTNHSFPNGAGGHAVTATRCSGLKLEDVTLYASNCFGFLEDECDGSTYLRCKVDRRDPAGDPVKRGFARMRSLNADAFHSVGAAQGPAILHCTAKYQGDDCVNIHGTYHLVTGCRGAELRIAAVGRMTIEPGDPVEFLPYEGRRPADARAVKIEPDETITEKEKAFIRKIDILPQHKDLLLEGKAKFFKLTLDRAETLPAGSAVCSGKRVGNGFAVKGCDFGYNRSRGILIKASRGEVSGNTIAHGWMAAVLVAPEFWWFESASSSDVVIRDNKIIGCRRPAIEVIAPGGNGKPLPSGAHRNISILDNTLTESTWPNIRVTSTDVLVIRGNRLTPKPPALVPPVAQPWDWKAATPTPIVVEMCEGAEVQPTGP
jgi:hypothetical protein